MISKLSKNLKFLDFWLFGLFWVHFNHCLAIPTHENPGGGAASGGSPRPSGPWRPPQSRVWPRLGPLKMHFCANTRRSLCFWRFSKITKKTFRKLKDEKNVRLLTKKPLTPLTIELNQNNRSRSAKLRALESIAQLWDQKKEEAQKEITNLSKLYFSFRAQFCQ